MIRGMPANATGQKTQTAKSWLKPATCRNLGYVAQAFNVSRRRDTLVLIITKPSLARPARTRPPAKPMLKPKWQSTDNGPTAR